MGKGEGASAYIFALCHGSLSEIKQLLRRDLQHLAELEDHTIRIALIVVVSCIGTDAGNVQIAVMNVLQNA